MFRFRIGSIPVDVHFSHFAMSGLIAWITSDGMRVGGWPGAFPEHLTEPSQQLTFGLLIMLWMLIVFVSVLVHELGHALVARAFGYRPSIQLVGLGGLTHPNANETVPWHRDVLVTLAGPLSGLALGLTAGAIGLAVTSDGPLRFLLSALFAANLFWTVLNLLPVSALDGGRIASAVMIRVFGRPGFLVSQLLSVALGGAMVLLGALTNNFVLAVIFGMNVVRAVAQIAGYWRGELPPLGPTHPFELGFLKAQEEYGAGKLEAARTLLDALAQQDLQPSLRARVHDLAGWVAVKLGEGRAALDHFSQVSGLTVAPQALAAAFSLIGDDHRAIALWAQAARESNDPTLLHEWAGALVRDGQVSQALGLPGVKPALAHAAAARTWFVRKDYLNAALASEASFKAEASSARAYDAGCAFALAGKPDDALRMLQAAGPVSADSAQWDSELVSLRNDPRFTAWIASLRKVPRA
jgi:Zn-dependent protease